MRIIIFDLFGTLIEKDKYDYDAALEWLANKYFKNKILELKESSKRFKLKYLENRKSSHKENSFFEQLVFFENEFNIKILDDFYAIELQFINIFRKEKLTLGASDILEYLHKSNYRIFILSNSIFSGISLKTYLNDLGIGKYIEKVYSSADIGYRKPSREAFINIANIANSFNAHDLRKIYFVGDSLEKDYNGAKNIGFTPILIKKNDKLIDLSFDNLFYFLRYLRENYN